MHPLLKRNLGTECLEIEKVKYYEFCLPVLLVLSNFFPSVLVIHTHEREAFILYGNVHLRHLFT